MTAAELAEASKVARARAVEAKAQALAEASRLRVAAEDAFSATEKRIDIELRAELARREAALAADYHSRLAGLLVAYFTDPARSIARDIASVIRELDAKALVQIGQPSCGAVLTAAAMAAAGKFARAGLDSASHAISSAGAVRRAALQDSIIDLERGLEALQRAMANLQAGTENERQLHAALASECVSTGTFAVRRARFDSDEAAANLARQAAAYSPPVPPPARTYHGTPIASHYGISAADMVAMRLREVEADAADRAAIYGPR